MNNVYCVAITFKITEWVEQQICIRFCIKFKHSSVDTIRMIQKAVAMGNWWLTAPSWQHTCSCITCHKKFLAKQQVTQVSQHPYSPDLVPYDFWLFPKLKSPLKGKRFQTINKIQEKYNRAADGNWENCVRSQGAYFKGDWGIIVLCTMFLVSCILFRKCLFFILHGWIPSGHTHTQIRRDSVICVYILYSQVIFMCSQSWGLVFA